MTSYNKLKQKIKHLEATVDTLIMKPNSCESVIIIESYKFLRLQEDFIMLGSGIKYKNPTAEDYDGKKSNSLYLDEDLLFKVSKLDFYDDEETDKKFREDIKFRNS